jgi:hypothetical protein
MITSTDVFVAETNVEMYLSKAYECLDANTRDVLLRLLAEEEARMGASREHMENGHRRLDDCKGRVRRQRELVSSLAQQGQRQPQEQFLLDTLEKTLVLMQQHQRFLNERFKRNRL